VGSIVRQIGSSDENASFHRPNLMAGRSDSVYVWRQTPLLRGSPPVPEPQGPWSLPPTPPPGKSPTPSASQPASSPGDPPARRVPIGLIIWLALIGGAVGAYVVFTLLFPGQTSGMDQADALRLLGLLALVSTGLVFLRRVKIGEALRNIAIWLGVAGVAVAGYAYRGELSAAFDRVRSAVLPSLAVSTAPHVMVISASADGGFYVQGQLNGKPVRFVIDTGASGIVLSPADAQRAGVDLSQLQFAGTAETANGVGQMAPYTAPSLDVGAIHFTNVKIAVDRTPMSASLLGMDFLHRFDSIEIHGDQLTLKWRG
jgi:aspartyl protease family protein